MAKQVFRKKKIINPSFQFKIIGFMLAGIVLSVVSFFVCASLFFDLLKGKAVARGVEPAIMEIIKEVEPAMTNLFLMASGVSIIAITLVGIYVSHRIAGPLYNLCRYLDDQSQPGAKARPLSFRPGDFFQEIPYHVNNFISQKVK
ncbi:MAG: hypothetical protein KDD25_05705 [Bdellovibrionales bacterium]|nr:hypothetical protein [Bdellovibrionales bacterium]